MRAVLVVSEVALACMLLVSAGLLLRSFLKVLMWILASSQIVLRRSRWRMTRRSDTSWRASSCAVLCTRKFSGAWATLPGVEAAGIADYLPLGPNRDWDMPVPKGKTFAPGALPSPLVYVITPGFIRAMGIRLHGGRDFTWDDGPKSERVVLINASAARSIGRAKTRWARS